MDSRKRQDDTCSYLSDQIRCVCNPALLKWKHPYFRDIKRLYKGFWEWFRSREDFFRLPSPLFSAAAELRTLTADLCNLILCSRVCPEL
jgi:hypothetical protein